MKSAFNQLLEFNSSADASGCYDFYVSLSESQLTLRLYKFHVTMSTNWKYDWWVNNSGVHSEIDNLGWVVIAQLWSLFHIFLYKLDRLLYSFPEGQIMTTGKGRWTKTNSIINLSKAKSILQFNVGMKIGLIGTFGRKVSNASNGGGSAERTSNLIRASVNNPPHFT